MEKYNPLKNSHGSKTVRNPLREWRGKRDFCTAADLLNLSLDEYVILESHPERSDIKSNDIIAISHITSIPLAVLVDYLTETTKEVVSC